MSPVKKLLTHSLVTPNAGINTGTNFVVLAYVIVTRLQAKLFVLPVFFNNFFVPCF